MSEERVAGYSAPSVEQDFSLAVFQVARGLSAGSAAMLRKWKAEILSAPSVAKCALLFRPVACADH